MDKWREYLQIAKEMLGALLVALLIQTFVVMHINIPSESMVPTIQVGDHLLVSQLPLYYRHPIPGEMVVFEENGIQMIKRVIAGPGQVVDIREGQVFVDDVRQEESAYLNKDNVTEPYYYSSEDITYPYEVPEDHYFMMGDNRLHSRDSRDYGPVHRQSMIALAGVRIYPFNTVGKVK